MNTDFEGGGFVVSCGRRVWACEIQSEKAKITPAFHRLLQSLQREVGQKLGQEIEI